MTRWAMRAIVLTIVLATVLAVVADTALWIGYPSARLVAPGWPVLAVGSLLSVVVGTAILRRYPTHRIGWLFLASGLIVELSTLSYRYVYLALESGELSSRSLAQVVALIARPLDGAIPAAVLALLFLLFPDGEAMSRRWAGLAWFVSLAAAAFVVVELLFARPGEVRSFSDIGLGDTGELVLGLLTLAIFVTFAASAVGLVVRVRRSRGVQRQQLRWLATAAVAIAACLLLAVLWPSAGDVNFLRTLPLHLAFLALPVAAGFAVLRYRLYDLDVFISAAVVGAVLVAFVSLGYVAVVVLLGGLVGGATPFWASVLATAVVALAFQPLRRRVDRLARRLTYGERAAPYEALAELNQQLASSLQLDELLPRIAEAAAGSVGARRSVVSVDVPGTAAVQVAWPGAESSPAIDAAVELLVEHAGHRLGTITLELPPGRTLARDERRMLADFASQCALALRNAQLAAALQARSDQLGRDAAAIAASRARLVEAATTEAQRIAAAIGRDVLVHLDGVDGQLLTSEQVMPSRPTDAVLLIDSAAESTGIALDRLRTLTRRVFPAQLARNGLVTALNGELERSGQFGALTVGTGAGNRYSDRLETAVYFCAVEALRDLVPPVEMGLQEVDGFVELWIEGALPEPAAGMDGDLAGLRLVGDRADALGGSAVITRAGSRPSILVRIPVEAQPATATLQAVASRSGPKADLGT